MALSARPGLLPLWFAGALGASVAPICAAQAPVDDLAGRRTAATQAIPAAGAGELFAQLQQLQEELRQLRGQLEEQAHQLRQLEQLQKDNYLDLDGRLSVLATGGPAPDGAAAGVGPESSAPETAPPETAPAVAAPSPAAGADIPQQPSAITAPAPTAAPQPAGAADQAAYDRAYELLKQGRMDDAKAGFEAFASQYPGSSLMPNALYWMGEIHLVKNDQDAALVEFSRIVDTYPEHPKAADAHYKLGTLYLQRNDKTRARGHLERAVLAGGSVAALAKRYLDTHF